MRTRRKKERKKRRRGAEKKKKSKRASQKSKKQESKIEEEIQSFKKSKIQETCDIPELYPDDILFIPLNHFQGKIYSKLGRKKEKR